MSAAFSPCSRRLRFARIEGDAAWEIIDRISTKCTGAPYPRREECIVAVVEPERQTVGIS